MELEVGRIYRSRNHRKALVVSGYDQGSFPMWALFDIFYDKYSFTKKGTYCLSSSSGFDLLEIHPDCKNVKNFKLKK